MGEYGENGGTAVALSRILLTVYGIIIWLVFLNLMFPRSAAHLAQQSIHTTLKTAQGVTQVALSIPPCGSPLYLLSYSPTLLELELSLSLSPSHPSTALSLSLEHPT